jgi:predicted membrane protein
MNKVDTNKTENFNDNSTCKPSGKGRNFFGLVVALVGVVWLLRRAELLDIPSWVLSWPMILIVVGFFHAVRHRFQDAFSFILILVGSVFLARNYFDFPFELEVYLWPGLLIVIGLVIFFKPKKTHRNRKHWKNYKHSHFAMNDQGTADSNMASGSDDVIDSVAIFSGVQKEVTTSNFKGGQVVAVFGGAEIDFSRADMVDTATLDVTAVFGGVQLIVPPHWNVMVNTVNIAGGVEDKRRAQRPAEGANKQLIITGNVIFAGLEIKTF